MKTGRLSLVVTVILAAASALQCNQPPQNIIIDDPVNKDDPNNQGGNEQGTGEPKTLPIMGGHTIYNITECPEMSGLTLSKDKDFIWAVGDEGQITKIEFNGKSTAHWYHEADMEDVTLDPRTGDLYIAIEGEQKIYKVDAPKYDTYSTLFYVQDAVDGNYKNNGLEGISYYKDNLIFIGAQTKAMLWLYDLDGTEKWGKSLLNVCKDIKEIGGLCYDSEKDLLWITDSKACKLFIINTDATKCFATYDVSFIDNAESILVDHKHSCVWVGSDEDNPKLYKIEFAYL